MISPIINKHRHIAAFRWMEEKEVCVSRAAVMAWNQDGASCVSIEPKAAWVIKILTQ